MIEKSFNKVFCIGPNKTGTTSLHDAFVVLGLRSVHWMDPSGRNIQDIIKANYESGDPILKGLEDFDAYTDWIKRPTIEAFKLFDKEHPNSKFILNTRDMVAWMDSREKHVLRNQKEVAETGDPTITWLKVDRAAWEVEFTEQHRSIREHFKGRENDLLEFDVTKGDGWEKLCPFLGMPIPNVPFPVSNKAPVAKVGGGPAKGPRSLWKRIFG